MARRKNDMVDNVHNLERTGMTRAQAEAMVKVMQDRLTEAVLEATSHLATKAELAVTQEQLAATQEQLVLLRAEMIEKLAASEKHITLLVSFSTLAIVTTMIGAVVFG